MADSGEYPNEIKWETVKQGLVTYGGKQMTLLLTSGGLTLKDDKASGAKKNKGLELSWVDVIAAQPSNKFKGSDEKKGFCVHYMELQSNKKLQSKKMDVLPSDGPADVWIEMIQKQCASVEDRPKKLFVVINPISGAQSGQQVYEKRVRPVFELAQIQADVQVTERAKHMLEIAENQDFSSYDGIVVMGGDGSYHEMVQGLTIQTQRASGMDYNDSNNKLTALSNKPIGVIPTGTGNGVSGFVNGVVDVDTAVLRVIRGERHAATAFSIYNKGKLFAICGLSFAYGLFCDFMQRTDELRWMKRARYPYTILAGLFAKTRDFRCDLEYRLAPDTSGGESISASGDEAPKTESDETVWMKHDSKNRIFKGVSAFVANIERNGEKVYVDAFSNHISLLVDHGCSFFGLMKFLLKLRSGKPVEPLPSNLDVIKNVQGIRFKLIRDNAEPEENLSGAMAKRRELEHLLSIDGEPIKMEVPEFEMGVLPSFVTVFGIHHATM